MCAAKYGISDATFYNWRSRYGGMEVSDARKLNALEDENRRLKKLLAETMLMHRRCRRCSEKNLTPGLRKCAVTWAIREKNYSQRRACGLVGLHPKTYRYATKRLAMKSFAGGCESLPHNGGGLAIVVFV